MATKGSGSSGSELYKGGVNVTRGLKVDGVTLAGIGECNPDGLDLEWVNLGPLPAAVVTRNVPITLSSPKSQFYIPMQCDIVVLMHFADLGPATDPNTVRGMESVPWMLLNGGTNREGGIQFRKPITRFYLTMANAGVLLPNLFLLTSNDIESAQFLFAG